MAYEPKTWECGDTITAEELNRMEQGIAEASQSGGGTTWYKFTVKNTSAVTISANSSRLVYLYPDPEGYFDSEVDVTAVIAKIYYYNASASQAPLLKSFACVGNQEGVQASLALYNPSSEELTLAVGSIEADCYAPFPVVPW